METSSTHKRQTISAIIADERPSGGFLVWLDGESVPYWVPNAECLAREFG